MTPTDIRDRIKKALDEADEFDAVDLIPEEKATLGIATADGERFFVEIVPA